MINSVLNNFGGLPKKILEYSNSKIVILPVPYDETSTWIKGADKGPDAIIEASKNMELYDIETDSEVFTQGIFTDESIKEKSSPENMVKAVNQKVNEHLKTGKFIVLIGGEHSVSIGSIKAHSEHYKKAGEDFSVLQLDAHTDLRQEYEGSKNNHACVMARARELANIVQVGIRSMDSAENEFIDKKSIFFAEKIHDNKLWMDKAVSKLKNKVYLTIDLDAFDPSIMPSTGTPEPGGMLWYDTLEFLKKVISEREVVGIDVVELCPNKNNKGPDFLAAKLIYKLLSYKFSKNIA